MNKAYLYLARAMIQIALRQLVKESPKLFFLSGWVGTLIAVIFSPLLGYMLSKSILNADFKIIDKSVDQEADEFFNVYRELDALNKSNTPVTEAQKQEMLKRVKEVTVRLLSVKKYLKQ